MLDGDAVTLIAWQNGRPVLKNGLVATEQACCCGKCSGPCTTSVDCDPGCRCLGGQCVEQCSGPCASTEDCAPGCACVFGECIQCAGCLAPSNCTLTAVIEWSDNTTETVTYPDQGSNLGGFLFGPCLIGYSYGDVNGNSGIKSYYMECEQCCDDGTGKNCVIGALREETYDTIDPAFDYATSITLTLTCDPAEPDPCNPFP